ncbi:hypothetical protein [Cetobacterium sp. SF1]|uniref:hypothetical protein n=1 Tax=Cetobacterium sp. SF1 TaxID=3417654 RepID=UPI003CEC5DC0
MTWDDYIEDEYIDTPEVEIVEENIYVDEKFIKNKELIRLDLNIIQFPIFSKNTQRKINQVVKYFFNKNRDTYITVSPKAGDYIPGEMEEKVFIALMEVMKEKHMPQRFVVSAPELREKLKLNSNNAYTNIIKKSLLRLSETNYNFKNTMYSSELSGIIKEEISTSILSLRVVNLSLKMNQKYREKVNDKRIKEIYEISISDHFYKNIIQKGYLVYNSEILLDISSTTARTVYMLIEKIRFQNLYLKLDTMFLIKRIPLKYDKKNISRTIKTLENALNELVEKNLILDFKFIKESTWEKSEIEINFPESSNLEKQERFYEDRNDFRKIITLNSISETEHEMLEEREREEENNLEKSISEIPTIATEEQIDKILGLLPSRARNLKTMPRTIKDAIEKYGYERVKNSAIYTKKQKADKVRSYFLKTLENNWCEHEEEIVIQSSKIDSKEFLEVNPSKDIPEYNEEVYKEFKNFPEEKQKEIEKNAYQEYVTQCGMNTKVQQIAFKYSKRKYICEYLEKHQEKKIEPPNNEIILEKKEVKEIEIEEIRNKIIRTIELGNMIYFYTDEEKKELFKNILKEVMRLNLKKELTEEALIEIIGKYIDL